MTKRFPDATVPRRRPAWRGKRGLKRGWRCWDGCAAGEDGTTLSSCAPLGRVLFPERAGNEEDEMAQSPEKRLAFGNLKIRCIKKRKMRSHSFDDLTIFWGNSSSISIYLRRNSCYSRSLSPRGNRKQCKGFCPPGALGQRAVLQPTIRGTTKVPRQERWSRADPRARDAAFHTQNKELSSPEENCTLPSIHWENRFPGAQIREY